MRRLGPTLLTVVALLGGLASQVHAQSSDFWAEVRTPGTRRYLALVSEADGALRDAPAESLVLAREAIALLPERPEAYFVLGLANASLGRLEEATEALDRFRALGGRPTPSRRALDGARVYQRAGQTSEAASFVREVAIVLPKGVERDELYVAYGELLLGLGPDSLDAALRAFRWAVLDVSAPSPRAELGLALALHRSGEREAAHAHAARAVTSNALPTLLELSLFGEADRAAASGVVSEALGRFDEAAASFGRAAEVGGAWAEHDARARAEASSHARGRGGAR